MDRIIQGVQRFQTNIFPKNQELFQRLALGQDPEFLFVCCSDSRISLDMITQTGPGDLFVCRNAGNIVPVYGQGDAVSATIEYALAALKINHIVVCGHSHCGAMKGLLHPETTKGLPEVTLWLRHAEAARCAFELEEKDQTGPGALAALTKLNVRLQLAHLQTHSKVFARVQAGTLHLHGWYYEIESGDVQVWAEATEKWLRFDQTPLHAGVQETQHA